MNRKNTVVIRLLGELAIEREAQVVNLPKSRKARALFAYLAMADKPVSRIWLSHFLFSGSADPKGNLRWCLSRLRSSCSAIDANLFGSNATELWLNSNIACIDINELAALPDQDKFGEAEYQILERASQQEFLQDLKLANSVEFEAWRATSQSRISSKAEDALDKAISTNFGSELAVRFAHLYVSFAPHSERAWFLLVKALKKTRQTIQAQTFLKIAHEQLKLHKVLHTGLLALAANELSYDLTEFSTDSLSDLKHREQQRPRLIFKPLISDVLEASNLYDTIIHHIVLNRTFDVVMAAASENSDHMVAEFSAVAKLYPLARAQIRVEIQLICNRSKICLWDWLVTLASAEIDTTVTLLKKWLSERFELDIPLAMFKHAKLKDTDQLTASDYYFLGLPKIHTPAGYSAAEAHSILQKSLQYDANFGPALCALAWVRVTHGYYNQVDVEREKSAQLARRAIELSYDDAAIVAWAGISLAHLELNVDLGLSFAERALSLNPDSPLAILLAALMHHYGGDYHVSMELLRRLDCSDVEPLTFLCDTFYSINHYQLKEYEQAVEFGRRAVDRNPRYNLALRTLTASLIRLERPREASLLANRMVALETCEHIEHYKKFSMYKDPKAHQRFCNDLAAAGIPQSAPSAMLR